MWTDTTRKHFARVGLRLPSDFDGRGMGGFGAAVSADLELS
jgi:hypothetical protein